MLLNNPSNHKPSQPKFSRNVFSAAIPRPAAEEQFLEQTPWANPQHPIHQHRMARLSRQASDPTQLDEAAITPATQKGLIDPNRSAPSSSTLPERQSAQGSSAWVTPHSNSKELAVSAIAGESASSVFDQAQKRDERLQSLSPTEIRRHHLSAYQPGPSKSQPATAAAAASSGGETNDADGTQGRSYKSSRISLFGSPVRTEAVSRNGMSNAEIDGHDPHTTPSAINLHQHGPGNHLPPVTGLSRIGAR